MNNRIIEFKTAVITFLIAILAGVGAKAQTPAWTVNPGDYRYDMSIYMDVAFKSQPMDYSQYIVAAFVGDECRGIAETLDLPDGKQCLYMRVRSNRESGETLTFKYRNKLTDDISPIDGVTEAFESNGRIGYPSDPLKIVVQRYLNVSITAGDGGSVTETADRVQEGTVLTITATPNEGHYFLGWSDGNTENPRTITVDEDITLAAEFGIYSYKLIYTLDGETYNSSDVEYGTALTPLPNPEKEGYTFSGWQGLPETMPAHDVTVTGTFSINTYKAIFKIGEDIIATLDVVYGQPVTAPEAPAKEGHTFAGWQNVPATMPAHDVTVLGSYTVNKYKLIYTLDGVTYNSSDVEYGTVLTPLPNPEKEGYTFSGWQGLPETMPAHDVTVTGTFSINTYKAIFKIGEDIIATLDVVFGQPVTAPEAPAKEGHTFAGWQNVPATMPAHDVTILGSYTVNKYKLNYVIDGEPYKSVEVKYGATIVPESPEKEGYTFSGWQDLPETMPAHDVTATGTFSINSYKLTVYLNDKVYLEETLEYGAKVTIPEPTMPNKNCEFQGWEEEVPETMPAHDVTIHGKYIDYSGVARICIDDMERVTVCTPQGVVLFHNRIWQEIKYNLSEGIYIINGMKFVIR